MKTERADIFSCKSGEAFRWPKGVRLEATGDVMVILPGGILVDGKPIGEQIEAPKDVMIGFDPAPGGKGFDAIRVALKAGHYLGIQRSSMAAAHSDQTRIIRFRILQA